MQSPVWPALFLVLGLLALFAEVLVPSGGILGVFSFLCLSGSLVVGFRQSWDVGLGFLLANVVLVPIGLMAALAVWPRTPFAKKSLLRQPDVEEMAVSHSGERLDHLVGGSGVAVTALRPSGKVEIDRRRFDVMSDSGWIDVGSEIVVIGIRSGYLIVRAVNWNLPVADSLEAF